MSYLDQIRQELIERYNSTGRVGFTKPTNLTEALELIETITNFYDDTPEEPVVYNLSDLTNKLKTIFDD